MMQVHSLIKLRDKLLEFANDKVAAIGGPVGVAELLLIVHLSVMSDNDAAIIFESAMFWNVIDLEKRSLTQGGT